MTTTEPSKACSTCKDTKPLSEYHRDGSKKAGLSCRCKPCTAERCARRYKASPEKAIERSARRRKNSPEQVTSGLARWYSNNAEKVIKRSTRWAMENPEKATENHARWRTKNSEKIAENGARWSKDNPDRKAAQQAKRRASKLQATPAWANHAEIAKMYKLADMLSVLNGVSYHVGHIYPLHGKTVCGLHVHQNLQVLPSNVNLSKSNKVLVGDHT